MIYDLQSLKIKYKDYKNLNQKISIECKKGNLIRIKKGLYSDDIDLDKLVIANICYEPSYISFEYALSYYGLIPEHVSVITSTTFNKKNNKRYVTNTQIFEYKSIPNDAYHYGIVFQNNEKGIKYKIATIEKALCDLLYIKKPVRSIKDLKILLFEDLRMDEEYFWSLNFNSIKELMNKYHSNNIKLLAKYIGEKHDNN